MMQNNNNINWLDVAFLAGCIVYFIIPTDLIPDFIAGVGFTDDVAVLGLAFRKAYSIFTQSAKNKAVQKTAEIFGDNFDADKAAKLVYGLTKGKSIAK